MATDFVRAAIGQRDLEFSAPFMDANLKQIGWFVLVTCHTPGIGPSELSAYLADGVFGHCGERAAAGELFLETSDGRKLASGVFARWPR